AAARCSSFCSPAHGERRACRRGSGACPSRALTVRVRSNACVTGGDGVYRVQSHHKVGLMFGLKMGELLIIFLVILVLFGGTKLPQLGSPLGRATGNFKRGSGGGAQDARGEARRRGPLSGATPAGGKPGPRPPASAGKDA